MNGLLLCDILHSVSFHLVVDSIFSELAGTGEGVTPL